MPQAITVRLHKTITLAANDLCTVTLSNSDGAEVYMKNTGPGKVWVSFDTTKPASVANVDNAFLAVNDSISFRRLVRNTIFTCNADTASTILTLTQY